MEGLWGRFRDPETGKTSRAPRGTMTSETDLTDELRVQVVFMMIHVLRSQTVFLDVKVRVRVTVRTRFRARFRFRVWV